ncbi:hypothetical protein [Herbaspirillum sp. YR522]|uniref:hypothetical protein n=1 Tax=Herbaspirillum sp. YR522 TaxID=1144342 RepID=UPI00026F5C81|nr:hypothetical protein [Herbaspirillum sp. YR522]EJN07167.1 hypothetical protein PMI40_01949 [Herbaspirillum sp. YR522]
MKPGRWVPGWAVIVLCGLAGCGEAYRPHGRAISRSAIESIVDRGYCRDMDDFRTKMHIFGGHGRQANFTIYAPQERRVLAAYIAYIAVHGLAITKRIPMSDGKPPAGGVPISVKVYPRQRRDYGSLPSPGHTPIIKMKVENDTHR